MNTKSVSITIAAAAAAFLTACTGAIGKEPPIAKDTAEVENAPLTVPLCNGGRFSGTYIVKPVSGVSATAETFNQAAGSDLVESVRDLSGGYIVVESNDPAEDCNVFMQKMRDTGLVDIIEPDMIAMPAGPGAPM